MLVDDTISEFLGALANMVTEAYKDTPQQGKQQLQKDDLNEIFKRTQILTVRGDNYQRPHDLVKKAVEYWDKKNCPAVVENIKAVLPL